LNADLLFCANRVPIVTSHYGFSRFHYGFIDGFSDIPSFGGVNRFHNRTGAWNLLFVINWFLYGKVLFLDALFINRSVGVVFDRDLIGLPNWFLYGEVFFLNALFVNGFVSVVFDRNLVGLPNWFLYGVMFFFYTLFVNRFVSGILDRNLIGLPNGFLYGVVFFTNALFINWL